MANYGLRAIISMISAVIMFFIGRIASGAEAIFFNPRVGIRKNLVNSNWGGTAWYLLGAILLVFSIYNLIEWNIKRKSNQVSGYDPLSPRVDN